MENSYTLTQSCTLPSLGKMYDVEFDPHITLRSMTTLEEMRRLSHSERPLKVLCDIIDDCMVEKCPISSYDMIISDYQYLLHQLRIVTYGPKYKLQNTCPYCLHVNEDVVDLSQLNVLELDEDINDLLVLVLPRTKHKVKLRMQTPRLIDDINLKVAEAKKRSKTSSVGDPTFLFSLQALIDTVDDQELNAVEMEKFIQSLPMADANKIIRRSEKLVQKVGLDLSLNVECAACGGSYESTFRQGPEFFGPTDDE